MPKQLKTHSYKAPAAAAQSITNVAYASTSAAQVLYVCIPEGVGVFSALVLLVKPLRLETKRCMRLH